MLKFSFLRLFCTNRTEYVHLGVVTDFETSFYLGHIFKGFEKLSSLISYGWKWNNVPSNDVVIFLENHDKQRDDDDQNDHNDHVINYKTRRLYTMAMAFLLAHSYGTPCLMSSFDFTTFDQGIL